jgi:hypothetical protein
MQWQWAQLIRDGIRKIVMRTLSGLCYLCQHLTFLVEIRILLIPSTIGELYLEFPANAVRKQGEEILKAALVKSWHDSLSGILIIW